MNCFAPEGDQARVYMELDTRKEIEPDFIMLLLSRCNESPKDASKSQIV